MDNSTLTPYFKDITEEINPETGVNHSTGSANWECFTHPPPNLNHGRGTDYPFTVIGGPMYKGIYGFSFTPVSMPSRAEDPIYQDQTCSGQG